MSNLQPLMLTLALWLPADSTAPTLTPSPDLARLREMLQDRHHLRNQTLAAMLLAQTSGPEAEEIIRQGLKQTDAPEVFLALASALRLKRDSRFNEELHDAVLGGRPAVRQMAAETLAIVADHPALLRLQSLIDDARVDCAVRQVALAALAHSGRKTVVLVLIEQLSNKDEGMRRTAFEALAELTGQTFGADAAHWRAWWQGYKDRPNEQWLEDRLAFQTSRARRLDSDLDRTKSQLVQLHQQLYQRLPPADRLGHVQTLADNEDPTVRALAVTWATEQIGQAEGVGGRALAELLLRLSHDGNLMVQRPAVLALGRVSAPQVVDQLRRLLKSGHASVRAAAASALAQQVVARSVDSEDKPPFSTRNEELLREIVPLLQKALDDPALEVVIASAENLGTLGVPEAGPVLASLLKHQSESVRQTAAQALERVADPKVFDGVVGAMDDPIVAVRFGLVGALGRIATDNTSLTDPQRARMIARLEDLVLRDPDAGVRSRAATVIGQCGPPAELSFLWRRVLWREDNRVQEKSWAAMTEILARAANPDLLREWDRTLGDTNQQTRRVQLLSEVGDKWKKTDSTRNLVAGVTELLIQAHLEQGKWSAAFPLARELLDRPGGDTDLDRRLGWLLKVGERALLEGSKTEALRAVREAQPFLPRSNGLASDFEKLEKRARALP